jgi:2-keto-4-pentenoate hydratase/2-oxohepta-3-ene-1,7-dioic acid hydratase in catechol pathway
MKLLTIDSREVAGRPGALLGSGEILDLTAAPNTLSEAQWMPHSIVSILAAGEHGLERVTRLIDAAEDVADSDRDQLRTTGVILPFAGTALMPPVRRPGLVLVVDSRTDAYIKNPNAAVASDASVQVPWAGREGVTATGMLCAVVGRPLFRADIDEAEEAIAGYTVLIDLSASLPAADASFRNWRHYLDSKQFPGACPMGPVIVTRDEILNPFNLAATVRINGVEVAAGKFYAGIPAIGDLLVELSGRYGFRPGDLLAIEPSPDDGPGQPRELGPGDLFSVAFDGLPELTVSIS